MGKLLCPLILSCRIVFPCWESDISLINIWRAHKQVLLSEIARRCKKAITAAKNQSYEDVRDRYVRLAGSFGFGAG